MAPESLGLVKLCPGHPAAQAMKTPVTKPWAGDEKGDAGLARDLVDQRPIANCCEVTHPQRFLASIAGDGTQAGAGEGPLEVFRADGVGDRAAPPMLSFRTT